MRKGASLYYFANDHLVGTAVVMESADELVTRTRYYPYGNVWTAEGGVAPPTDRLFTGQRQYGAKSGIYYYGARFYSADIGRFLSPASIVPGAGNPQALNRYSYVLNNPLRYTDPSGHCMPGINCPPGMGGGGTQTPSLPASPPSCPHLSPCAGPAPSAPGVATCGGVVCGPPKADSSFPWWIELTVGTGVEFIPWYRIGDIASAAYFVNTCVSGDCDETYLIAAVPGLTIGMVRGARFLGSAAKLVDDAAAAGTIMRFRDAQKLTRGLSGDYQAHHILEQRHLKNWNRAEEIATSPSVVLSRAEHNLITSEIRAALPYGRPYTRQEVLAAYQDVYGRHHPEWLRVVVPLLSR